MVQLACWNCYWLYDWSRASLGKSCPTRSTQCGYHWKVWYVVGYLIEMHRLFVNRGL